MYVCIKCKLSFPLGTQQIDSKAAHPTEKRAESEEKGGGGGGGLDRVRKRKKAERKSKKEKKCCSLVSEIEIPAAEKGA